MSYDDFHSGRTIKAVRKARCCYQCNKKIEIGFPAEYVFGKYEGDVYSHHIHPECDAAATEYAKMNDLWGEEFPYFPDMDNEHHDWLLENHPIVAERLGIVKEIEA